MQKHELIQLWANQNYVRFVNRTHGQATTDTVSVSALESLVDMVADHMLEHLQTAMCDEPRLVIDMLKNSNSKGALMHSWMNNRYTEPQRDPCPGCKPGQVCRTFACGRLRLPIGHPLRTTPPSA